MTTIALPRVARRVWRRPDVSTLALRVWQRNRDVYLNLWKAEAMWPLVEPLVTLVALGIGLGDFVDIGGESYIDFIAPGMLAVFPMWMAAAEMGWGSFFRMDSQKTFDAIISTPASIDDVTTGEIFWGATRGFISICYIFVMVLVLGTIDSPLALLIFPLSFLPGLDVRRHGPLLTPPSPAASASSTTSSPPSSLLSTGSPASSSRSTSCRSGSRSSPGSPPLSTSSASTAASSRGVSTGHTSSASPGLW